MLTASALAVALGACGDEPAVATGVDLQRFEGSWHEIGHFRKPTQKGCRGTVATYSRLDDKRLSFVHACTLDDGSYYGTTAVAEVRDPQAPAKLAIDFGNYLGEYWILEVAPDYRYAVVGHPSRDYLWILSRTPQLAEDDRSAILAHAEANGFETKRLEYTPEGPEPVGTPAPAPSYGCAAAAVPRRGSLAAISVAAVAAIAAIFRVRRRRARASR